MLQLLLIARCVLTLELLVPELYVWGRFSQVHRELNQVSRICVCLAVHCMFVELIVVLKNNRSRLVVDTSLVPPCVPASGGAGGVLLLVLAGGQLGISDCVLTSVLLSPRHFFFCVGLHVVKHKSIL